MELALGIGRDLRRPACGPSPVPHFGESLALLSKCRSSGSRRSNRQLGHRHAISRHVLPSRVHSRGSRLPSPAVQAHHDSEVNRSGKLSRNSSPARSPYRGHSCARVHTRFRQQAEPANTTFDNRRRRIGGQRNLCRVRIEPAAAPAVCLRRTGSNFQQRSLG